MTLPVLSPPGVYIREPTGETADGYPRRVHEDPACRFLHVPGGQAIALHAPPKGYVVHCRRPA